MENINYTKSTIYTFYNNISNIDCNIKTIGDYSQDKIESILNYGINSDSWIQFNIPEIVDIPEKKPNIEGIVGIYSSISILCKRVIYTPEVVGYYKSSNSNLIMGEEIHNSENSYLTGKKLIISGVLRQKVIYTAETEQQGVHSASFSIPFTQYVLVDKETPISQNFKIYSYIEDIFGCRLSERSIFKNTTIFIKAVPCG